MNNPADISQAERRKILQEDRERLSTLLDHARSSVDDTHGGRFAAASPNRTVVGTSPISYPRLPADNPSNQAMLVPDEPPLGIDINAMEPVGEVHEQKASEGVRRRGWRRL
jgi:hypothetical protein